MKPHMVCLGMAGLAALTLQHSAFVRFCGPDVGPDVFKLTAQFLLISVVGGSLLETYKVIQRYRDRRVAERSLQRALLDDVVKAYNDAKKARRLLRAKAIKSSLAVEHGPYDHRMQWLMDAQLAFESFEDRVETDKRLGLYPKGSPVLARLRTMGEYLNNILEEYEKSGAKFSGQPPTAELKELQALDMFTREFKEKELFLESTFNKQFKKPFHEAVDELQSLIIK